MDKKIYTATEVRAKVRNYARYLKETHHIPIRQVYLFGSYAKKKAHAWSDIDVCIVSSVFEKQSPVSFLWRHRREEDVDAMISPVGFSPADFREKIASPLVHEIRNTGEKITFQ